MTSPGATAVRALLFATAIATGVPSAAAAEEPKGFVQDEREVAKAHFKQARAFHDAREYERAIIEYQAAYAIAPLPELLFNIGQCYRLRGEPRFAVLYYQRYLQLVPGGGASDEAREHVKTLRREIAAQAPGERQLAPTLTPAPRATTEDGGRNWRWIGAGGAAAGLALTGVGIYYGIEAYDIAQELESARGPFNHRLEELERSGRSAQTRALLFGGVGVSLAAAGAITWWMNRERETPGAVAATPVVGPGHAGIAVLGSF